MVATIQLVIMTGAALGGVAIDLRGAPRAIGLALVLFLTATAAMVLALRSGARDN